MTTKESLSTVILMVERSTGRDTRKRPPQDPNNWLCQRPFRFTSDNNLPGEQFDDYLARAEEGTSPEESQSKRAANRKRVKGEVSLTRKRTQGLAS